MSTDAPETTGSAPRPDHGFTLVEILISIVLVGILSAVVVVGVGSLTERGARSACSASLDASAAASVVHFTVTGAFPTTFDDMLALTPPALTLPSGATHTSTSVTGDGWTLTLAVTGATTPPTFSCSTTSGGSAAAPGGTPASDPTGAPGTGAPARTDVEPPTTTGEPAATTTTTTTPHSAAPTAPTAPATTAPATTAPATTASSTTAATTAATTSAASSAASSSTVTCPGTYSGWVGEYYHGTTLTGTPICRDDPTLSFHWGNGSPMSGIPADGFSVRWTRTVSLPAGQYTFSLGSDDGSRLYIDGSLAQDRWVDGDPRARTHDRDLAAGLHTFVVEYYDGTGPARLTFSWR